MNHTATPWKNGGAIKTIGWISDNTIADTNGIPIANFRKAEDAALSVKAVNCHDELVKALEEITDRYERLDKRVIAGQHNEPNGTIQRAKQALQKAGAL